jgi:uncharacterized protein YndB with AHSA1/START domain
MKSEVKIAGNEVQIKRKFSASRERVFSWWTKAEKLQQWSGCKEATRCEIQMDFRAGGVFTQTMHIRGAGDFTFSGEYDEILEPERIVYRAKFGPVTTRVTVEFNEQGSGTEVVITHSGCPDGGFSKNISQGTSESLDALELLVGE